MEDRWDFTDKDNEVVFPIKLQDSGGSYGFCPAKVLRDDIETTELFKTFVLSTETGQLPYGGSILKQPYWVVDILSWFIPIYNKLKWISNAKMILSTDKKKDKSSGNISRRSTNKHHRR